MIRATTLRGRAVVDIDSATKLGQVEELILDPEARHVAGLVVSQGPALLGDRRDRVLPAAAINAIGPDALTVHAGSAAEGDGETLASLPRLAGVTGRKVVTHSGRMVGVIGDVLIAPEDGAIIGYALEAHNPAARLEELFGGSHGTGTAYVRADAELRVGHDLVVVPDDALESPREATPAADTKGGFHVRWLHALSRPTRGSAWLGEEQSGGPTETPHTESPPTATPVHDARTRPVSVDEPPPA